MRKYQHFTEEEILKIIKLRKEEGLTITALALRFDHSPASIWEALRRIKRKNLNDDLR